MSTPETPASPPTVYDDEDGLDPRKLRLIEMTLDGEHTGEQIASELGISARTMRRWRKEPEIRAMLRERLCEQMYSSRVILTNGAVWASGTLVRIAAGDEPSDATRVAACRAVLEHATRLTEMEELGERVAALEARLAGTAAP